MSMKGPDEAAKEKSREAIRKFYAQPADNSFGLAGWVLLGFTVLGIVLRLYFGGGSDD